MFASSSSSNNIHKCQKKQSEALLLLKHNLSSTSYTFGYGCTDSYPIMMNWNISTDCCIWNGVTCDRSTGDVIGIDLSCGMLSGTIQPNSSLFNLPHLQTLNLAFNNFTGSQIPSEIGRFSNSLTHLDLSECRFSGQIDMQTFQQLTNLTVLFLSFNNFSGEWELDTLLSSLKNLEILDLSYSGLSVTTNNANHYVNPGFRFLNLASCKLKVFPESFRAMKQLEWIDLSGNEIHGQIPHWAGEIGRNELRYNMLSGNAPFESLALPSLKSLDLRNNQLSGQIDVQTFRQLTNLTRLDLSFNNFSGEWELDALLSSLTNLEYLDLSYSGFSVTTNNANHYVNPGFWLLNLASCKLKFFPKPVDKPMKQLQDLDLIQARKFHVKGNPAMGVRRASIWQVLCPQIKTLSWTYFNPSLCCGNFHSPCLHLHDLSQNGFVGQLPTKYFQNFNSMKNVVKDNTEPEYLDMGGKYYSFVVSVKGVDLDIPKLFVSLTIIDLSNNYFERGIPEIIGNLSALKVLNLSHNSLCGRIPDSLGKLTEIESLDLSWNQLTGNIPQSLAGIKGLEVLDLSQNLLVGRIPEGTQFNTFDESSFAGNLGLCGFPLPKKCSERTHKPQFEEHEIHEDKSGFTWEVVTLGYGCGTLLGLVMGYLMLSTRKKLNMGGGDGFDAECDEDDSDTEEEVKEEEAIAADVDFGDIDLSVSITPVKALTDVRDCISKSDCQTICPKCRS
ncbi:leucine-rich repeat-containing protein [Tanacetum coccineum]